jgi:iron(III) transport system ATP-binding protein
VISIRALRKTWPDGQTVLDGLSLEVVAGEILALLGPSGCGKTTLLRVIAGLEVPDAGDVSLDERSVIEAGKVLVPAERRGVGLVFQDFALFPHLDVRQNIGFGLRHLATRDRDQRVSALLGQFGLAPLAARRPEALSGGQQQRVALARALAPEPRVLLLDEPFSNLDASLRRQLRVALREQLKTIGVTTILVTHDEAEALSLADRVAVLDAGRVAQVAPPETIYGKPVSLAVARATGQINAVPGEAIGAWIRTPVGELHGQGPEGDTLALIRPEQLILAAEGGREGARARVTARDYTGAELELWLAVDGLSEPLVARAAGSNAGGAEVAVGDAVRIQVRGAITWCPR